MPDIWVAEDVPAHLVFTDEPDDGTVTREILRHRSRASASKAMGHYLLALGRRPHAMARGEYPVFCGAADAFKASGTTKEHTNMLWRIGGRVYRVRKAAEGNET